MSRVSYPARRPTVTAAMAASLWACCTLPVSAAPSPGVRFAIDGVGSGTFADAQLAANPGGTEEQPDSLCLTLEGGSPDNPSALLEWAKSNDAGGALASHPDATLTVLDDRGNLKKGVYRLTDITVRQFRMKADRDMSKTRLEGAEINCDSVDDAMQSG
jgi:hypothetical protein